MPRESPIDGLPSLAGGGFIPFRPLSIAENAIAGSALDVLMDKLSSFHDNPAGFVHWAFPWGEKGTELAGKTGPEAWQLDQMARIGSVVRAGGEFGCLLEEDVASGHGAGKSTLVSWLILWAISTFPDTRGVVTANTEEQLRKKTWAELAKWYGMFIAKALFKLTPTAIFIANDPVREKKWRIDQSPWSKENTEAFAGLHNQGKRLIVIFDEASSIDDKVWEVARGALTDSRTQVFWLRYGNPTRTSGEFYRQSTKPPSRKTQDGAVIVHNTARVDSRTISFTNKALFKEWVEEYGEDSDFVRVRVRGLFPRAGFNNFISPGLVTAARLRKLHPDVYRAFPKILSVDPARFGDDMTAITLRQGLKVLWQQGLQGFDGFDIAGKVQDALRKEGGVSCIVYDAVGNGAELDGVLKRIPGMPTLVPIMWGQPAKDTAQYFNQRSEAWGKMREWLEHGAIPDSDDLAKQLTALSYGYDVKMRIQLQSKKDLKKEGGTSLDYADSLALSFLPELIDRKVTTARVRPVRQRRVVWQR